MFRLPRATWCAMDPASGRSHHGSAAPLTFTFASETGHPADTLGAAPPEGVVLVTETHSHDVSFYTEEIG